MTAAMKEHRTAVVELGEEPIPSSYLARLVEELEQMITPRAQHSNRPADTSARVPRPFSHD